MAGRTQEGDNGDWLGEVTDMVARTAHKARELAIADIPLDRPIVTLDIDGVLNAFDHGRERHEWDLPIEYAPMPYRINHSRKVTIPAEMCEQMGYWPGQSFRITWSDDLMADIAELAATGKVTLVWLTSWNEFADFLGWKCFWRGQASPVLGYIDCMLGGRRSSYAGKLIVLRSICQAMADAHPDGDAPMVVAYDDDAPWEWRGWRDGDDDGRETLPDFFLGMKTDPRYGITKSQWEDVLEELGIS